MNILFHCSEYPTLSKSGGIGTATRIVAEELAKRGHQVYVAGYYPQMKGRKEVIVLNNVNVFRFNYGFRRGTIKALFIRVLNYLKLAGFFVNKELVWYENNINTLIQRHNIQILELTDFYGINGYNAHLCFRKFGIPTVLRVHGSMSFINSLSGNNNLYTIWNDREHFRRTDYLSSVSLFSQQYIDDAYGLDHFKDKAVIYNPIESAFLKENKPNDSKIILFIGKIIRTKGAFEVIKAFNRIAEEYPHWELRMIGKGDIDYAKKLVSVDNSDRVHFLGFCDRLKIQEEIDNCCFACIPSFFENFSMVPLEIMGRKRAVIFTNRTSGNEIICNGVDGFTVDPEDTNDIYNRIKTLIQDKTTRDLFAQRGYEKIYKSFTVDSIVSQLESFYSNCINKS